MKQFEEFRLDTSNECLWRNDVQLSLPPKPFAVLRYMVENPGRLITHDELLDALWPETYVQPQVLRTYVLELRKTLGDEAGNPRYIQTLPKRGYCFVASVRDVESKSRRAAGANPRSDPKADDHSTEALGSLVGRDKEFAVLLDHLDALSAGVRRINFVTGEAGMGKTALVDAFCRRVGDSLPAHIARGQCIKGFGKKEEYYPLIEALGQLCASSEGAAACQVLARMAPAWLALTSEAGNPAGMASARTDQPAMQERMPGELCAALEELCAAKPLILVLEDLQWADESTLHVLSALARRRSRSKLMVIATYRLKDVPMEHPLKGLKQDLLMHRLCSEIILKPLSKKAVAELLTLELKQELLPPGLAGFLHQHSEGNPLFLVAILEHLIAQHFLVNAGKDGSTRWELHAALKELDAVVPDELSQMIEFEIQRLSAEEQRVLEAASLMRVAFPAWALAAALEMDAAEVEEQCDALTRRVHFVERAGEDQLPDGTVSAFYVFGHALYREALYQRQSASRRAQRHTRIADRLAVLFFGRESDVAREMATHYEAACNWQSAVNALVAAAKHAEQRRAYAEANDLLDRAMLSAEHLTGQEREKAITNTHIESMRVRQAMVREKMKQNDSQLEGLCQAASR